MKMKNRMKKHSLKFVAAFLSILLWVYVLNSEKVKFEKTVSLEYIMTDGLIFAQKPPTEVTFLVEGPRAFVKTVAEREDKMIIDLNKANSKNHLSFNVDINPTQLSLPFGMVVERVLPRKIAIHLEKKASKIVPLKMQFTGRLPDDMMFKHLQLSIEQVEISGPRSVVVGLKELMIRPVELDNLMGQETLPVEVSIPDERLRLTSGSNITLSYELRPSGANFVLKNVAIKFLAAHKVDAKLKTAELRLMVPDKIKKNRLNISSSIQVWADIPAGKKGRIEVPLKVILPPSIHLLEIIPKSIIVNVR